MSKPWRSPTPNGTKLDRQPAVIIVAMTILGEAEGESLAGKEAVAWVIRNRVDQRGFPDNYHGVCLAPRQFSCWNDGSPRLKVMHSPKAYVEEQVWQDCFRSAYGAMYEFIPDPTHGANHYLNVELTKKLRGGSLPGWYDASRVTAEIGSHTFLRL